MPNEQETRHGLSATEGRPLAWARHKSPKRTNLSAASIFLARPLCHPPPAGALVFVFLQIQPLACALEEPRFPNMVHVKNLLLEKFFGSISFPRAAPLKPYSSRNSKLMIKDSVCIPLWEVDKMFIAKPNTNSELRATIFSFLGNFSRFLTALLLSTLKISTENHVKVLTMSPISIRAYQSTASHFYPLPLLRFNMYRNKVRISSTTSCLK